jgi:NitT/TauT family transport system permease protein
VQHVPKQPETATSLVVGETFDLPPITRRKSFFERKTVRRALPWFVIVAMFVLWELLVRILSIQEFVLPAPSAIFAALWEWRQPILENAGQTLMTTLIGFAIAIAVGAVGGIALGSSSVVYDGFYPALIAFNSVPKVAVIPVLVIWFGIGTVPAIITAFLLSFFPIMVNVATGIATVEPELRDVLRALGATKRQVLIKVGIPRAMPYFFASLKIAMTVAFVGSIVAETVAANAGIGYLMLVASSRFQVPLAFAGLLVTGLMGIGMYVTCAAIEQRMTGWAMRGSDTVSFTA